mmetsp:Transcript_25090/g.43924  ORF Transcript_25090/g.43924 Transcript_25090/m.43924 type:complete len:210 (+) Transcript_25090:223-852(+)
MSLTEYPCAETCTEISVIEAPESSSGPLSLINWSTASFNALPSRNPPPYCPPAPYPDSTYNAVNLSSMSCSNSSIPSISFFSYCCFITFILASYSWPLVSASSQLDFSLLLNSRSIAFILLSYFRSIDFISFLCLSSMCIINPAALERWLSMSFLLHLCLQPSILHLITFNSHTLLCSFRSFTKPFQLQPDSPFSSPRFLLLSSSQPFH